MQVFDMSWPEYADRITTGPAVIPIGAIEPHGPHLPLSTDTLVSEFFATRVADAFRGCVLPSITYGAITPTIRTGGEFPGIVGIGAATFMNQIVELLTALHRDGARDFILINSHIANVSFLSESIRLFRLASPETRVMLVHWWDVVTEETRDELAAEHGVPRDVDHHAAMVETSLVMYMRPELVKTELLADDPSERRVRYLFSPQPAAVGNKSGIIFNATKASARIGERVALESLNIMLDAVALEFGTTWKKDSE